MLGVTGGIIPCPAALVVLLSAAAVRRVGFGLFLIVCFSVGLAGVLIGMGLVAVYAARLMARLPTEGPLVQRWLPIASAIMIVAIGCAAGLIGTMWGLGHTVTIFIVGSATIIFNVAIPPRLGLSMELAVGVMLILLGVLTLTGTVQRVQQKLAARTPHGIALRGLGAYNVLRPVIVGVVHGLAGSAAVALLVMTTIHDPWQSIAYLVLFGSGTVAGMALSTVVISTPFVQTAHRFSRFNQGITAASGLISLGFGLLVSYRIGVVQGLFGSHPQWILR